MGLLNELEKQWQGLLAYKEANTPRSTRPVAKPSTVINEGLINPNPYNAVAANRFKDSAFGLLGVVPGVGDAASAAESADLFNRGENFAGSVAALGALPLVPALGGMFIGKGAKTWDVLKAQQAEELLKAGVDPREVWKQTGTAKFADGMLRQEIDDSAAMMRGADPTEEVAKAFREGGIDAMKARQEELAGYVRPYQRTNVQEIDSILDHDPLSRAYPDLYHYGKYQYDASNPRIGEGAYYSEKPGSEYATDFIKISPANEPTARSTTLHELQHAIQQREGWARGGSPENALDEWYGNINGRLSEIVKGMDEIPEWIRHTDPQKAEEYQSLRSEYDKLLDMKLGIGDGKPDAHEMYRRLAGEAEARLTQSRMGLDAAQRLEHYPYDQGQFGLDVPMDSLIVRGLLGENTGPAMSIADDAGGLLGKVDNSNMTFSDIRPPKENVNRVASSYSNSSKVVGNSTMPLASLKGGVVREVGDQSRVDKLAQQLTGDGAYLERLIVDDAGNVIEGQHRLEALRKLGVKDVPVVVIKDFARDFPTQDIKGAMAEAQKMPSDNANQLAAHLAEIFADEKGDLAEIAQYQAPRGFEKAWAAALKRLSGI